LFKYKIYQAQADLDKENLKELFAKCTASYDGMPHGTEVSNQTLNLVMSRNEPTSTMKKVRAIEIIYESLTKEWKEFCRLYYFEQEKPSAVMTHMNIEKFKFYSIKDKVIRRYKDMLPWKTFNKDDETKTDKMRTN
jgi:uncharacterized metal-binding protein